MHLVKNIRQLSNVYLQSTSTFGLSIVRSCNPFALQAFTNFDWAGCVDDRKSTGDFDVYMGPNLISIKTKMI